MVSTHRPAGASFGALWAAVSACLNFLAAFEMGLLGSFYLGDPALAIILAAFQLFLGFGMLLLSAGLYKVQTWARLLGMVLFAVFALFNLLRIFGGNYLSLIFLGLNFSAMFLLVLNDDAFGGRKRADISEGTASSYRPGR